MSKASLVFPIAACVVLLAPEARAQFAVIDVGAITQLVTEVQTLQSALDTARNQLTEAQAQYTSLTGSRGMDRLLAGTPRNYLPANWIDVQSVTQGGAGNFPSLAAELSGTVTGQAILSNPQLGLFPAPVQRQIMQRRAWLALSQDLSREELAATSARFAALQQLITTLAQTSDPKAVLDLQARIAAEHAMLQNEQTKLQTLQRLTTAEEDANQQQRLELAMAGHGNFAARFQPVP